MEQFNAWSLFAGLPKAILQAFGFFFSAWYMWAFILLMAALRLGPELYEAWRLRKAGMPEVDRMTGLEFEKYLEILFQRLGYQVERTRYVGDQGGDLILVKNGERILVQAKRHSKNVGNAAVQQATAARPHYNCHRAMVVANREFTRPARDLAKSNQVELWGRNKLAEIILSLQAPPSAAGPLQATTQRGARALQAAGSQSAPVKATPISSSETSPKAPAPTCQRCGKPMVLRDGPRGRFWGCSGFPKCRYTAELDEYIRS